MTKVPGPVADPVVVSLIPARPHTYGEKDHELFSIVILLPLNKFQEELLSVKSVSICSEYWLTA